MVHCNQLAVTEGHFAVSSDLHFSVWPVVSVSIRETSFSAVNFYNVRHVVRSVFSNLQTEQPCLVR